MENMIRYLFLSEPGSAHASLMNLDETEAMTNGNSDRKWPTGFLTQYKHLTIRAFKLSRSNILDISKILQQVVICAIFSLIWFQLPRSEDTLRDRMGAVSMTS